MSVRRDTLRVPCPHCGEVVEIAVSISHDPGCWRTKNGDGWPESWDFDVLSTQCPECKIALDTDERWGAAIETAFQAHIERPTRGDYE